MNAEVTTDYVVTIAFGCLYVLPHNDITIYVTGKRAFESVLLAPSDLDIHEHQI